MANQSATNVLAAIKRQTDIDTIAPSGGGADRLRLIPSTGLNLGRAEILSEERRQDQIRNLGRLGGKTSDGDFVTELTVGGAMDLLLESVARSAWTAAVDITETEMTSITTTTSTIVAAGGSWITEGVRVGDVVTLTGHSEAANNDLRLRVTDVTTSTITVAGTPLTAQASPDTSFTLTILKKVYAPASPTYHAYTIEQYDVDIDDSEVYDGTRLVGLQMAMEPNGLVNCTWSFMGLDRQLPGPASSPYFTSPALTTGVPLIADDAYIRYNGVDVAVLTGLTLNFEIANTIQPVIGSFRAPDVFMNDMTISGEVMAIRQDLQAIADFDAETEFEIHVVMVEPVADPKPCISVFLPRVKVSSVEADFLGGDGPKLETRNLWVGPHAGGTNQDATAVVFQSSAA